jgi:hypothetical protein
MAGVETYIKEIKFLMGIRTSSIIILTVDNLRLVRMQLQPAALQPRLNATFDCLRLLRALAVHNHIIGISLKRDSWIRLAHPIVECEMQEDVGQ